MNTRKEDVTRALKLISEFITQIPCHYLREDGSHSDLQAIQEKFEKLVRNYLKGNLEASKLDHIFVMTVSFKKATEDIRECQKAVKDGDIECKKQVIIVESIRVPEDSAIDQFLDDMMDSDDLL